MDQFKRVPLGLIAISVVMFFVALATDIFWIGKVAMGAFPSTMPIEERVSNAFAAPDILLSIFLYIGAIGLFRLKKFGLITSYLAMGMWLFDSTLVLGITRLDRINVVGPSLFFVVFTLIYLWIKRKIFE